MEYMSIKLHTDYSFLEGVGSIGEYVRFAKENNCKYLGITDNAMFGTFDFYEECKKNGIKPIIGIDLPVAGLLNKHSQYTITVIAKNNEGLKEVYMLSTMVSEKNSQREYIDLEEITNIENVHILSGGIKSELFTYIDAQDYIKSRKILKKLYEIFPKMYLELPSIKLSQEKRDFMYSLWKETNIQPVITNDVYYLKENDSILQKVVSAIKDQRAINSVSSHIKHQDLYFKKAEELVNIFPEDLENISYKNLCHICENSNVTIGENTVEFPNVDVPSNLTDREYIESLIEANLEIKYANKDKEAARKRVKYELDVIEKMGYIRYFLIVWDYIKYAKENDIYIGAGRGSAAGSIVSYLLNITEVDPIENNLIFERFLNPERISMPDIDVDVEQERRKDVIAYLRDKYGNRHFSQIITFNKMQTNLVVNEVSKALDINSGEQSRKVKKKIKEEEFSEIPANRLLDYSVRLLEKTKNISTHASGVIVTSEDIHETLPLIYVGDSYQIQFEASVLEKLGYLKMDVLGLKNLNIIKSIIKEKNLDLDIYNLPYEPKAFELFEKGNTLGIFQCESEGITKLGQRLKVNSIDDIALLLALYRPGPMNGGHTDRLVKAKTKGGKIEYIDPVLEDILKPTYGILIYQEQVMQLAAKISGYTLAEADTLRKAIAKRKHEILEEDREKFVKKSILDEKKTNEIYDLIESFGDYGFNKSHAVSYAKVTYQTAYLKALYPLEFYSKILDSENKDEKKLYAAYIEFSKMKYDFYGPDINISSYRYIPHKNGVIMPFTAIKDMSDRVAMEIIRQRERNGEFKDIFDFCQRCKFLNTAQIKSLIYSGCFDSMEYNRKTLIDNLDGILKWSEANKQNTRDVANIIFYHSHIELEDYVMDVKEEYPLIEIIGMEEEYIKISLTKMKNFNDHFLNSILLNKGYELVLVENMQEQYTKTRQKMATLQIYSVDKSGEHCLLFPKEYSKFAFDITRGFMYFMKLKKNEGDKRIISDILSVNDFSKCSIILKITEDTQNKEEIKRVIRENVGKNNLKFIDANGKKLGKEFKFDINMQSLEKLVQLVGKGNVKLELT